MTTYLNSRNSNWLNRFVVIFLFGLLAGCDDGPSQKKATDGETNQSINWQIFHKDSTSDQITFHITIDKRTDDKAQLIEIARKLKEEREWKEKLVIFYEVKVHSPGGAWASVAYLPNCNECGTDKDQDGILVEYKLIGMTTGMADTLKSMKMDSIPNKKQIAAYLEDFAKCKTIFYQVDNSPDKVLKVDLFTDGGKIVESLPVKHVDGQTRFYSSDPEEKVYYSVDDSKKVVNFYNSKGEVDVAYAMVQ